MKNFLFLLLLLPAAVSAQSNSSGPNREPRREQQRIELESAPQEAYRDLATDLIRRLIALGADQILKTANGKTLSLTELNRKIRMGIRYQQADRMPIEDGQHVDYCEDASQARWLTIYDDHADKGRLALVYYMQGLSLNHAQHDELLLFHESFSALGYVDDAYQISAALYFLFRRLQQNHSQNLRTLLNSPAFASLQKIKTRRHAPRFPITEEGVCHLPTAGQRVRVVGGGVIGSGGGGHFAALWLKYELLVLAEAWWRKNHGRLTMLNQRAFMETLLAVGIEPYLAAADIQSRIGQQVEGQGHYLALKIRYSPLINGPSFMVPKKLLSALEMGDTEAIGALETLRETVFRRLENLPRREEDPPVLIEWGQSPF